MACNRGWLAKSHNAVYPSVPAHEDADWKDSGKKKIKSKGVLGRGGVATLLLQRDSTGEVSGNTLSPTVCANPSFHGC